MRDLNLTLADGLPAFTALASPVRLQILGLLARGPRDLSTLAAEVGLSNAILTFHVRKLEEGGLVTSERVLDGRAHRKVCRLAVDRLALELAPAPDAEPCHEVEVPVGHYADIQAEPTCGIATVDRVLGSFDDPRTFLDPDRFKAGILWFGSGFVEYRVPNQLLRSQEPTSLEITMELGSEAPGVNNDWPSDLVFRLNGVDAATWTCPGDYGDKRGRFTPAWWPPEVGQYGVRKVLRVDDQGTWLDGQKVGARGLGDYDLRQPTWRFQIAAPADAVHPGGLTIYGGGFGNYGRPLVFRLAWRPLSPPPAIRAAGLPPDTGFR
jgi:predicted transcriptional regulator